MSVNRCILFLCCVCFFSQLQAQNYFNVRGRHIIDGENQPIVLRGINLGNWLLPEGYFFKMKKASSPRLIEMAFNELLGPADATAFWNQYLHRFITKADIAFISQSGANSIRIPFHYKLFTNEWYLGDAGKERGYRLMDSVIAWCRKYQLYVILDMHAAPCGQTGDNIDDSFGFPYLFQNTDCVQKTASIWKQIAAHYTHEKIIIGYDLLNEPIAHFFDTATLNPMLEPVYKIITDSIRQVDTNHLLFIGGAQWNSNFAPFSSPFDRKLVYTFHKYWTAPEPEVIQDYLLFSNKYNVPLYCGETGENSNEWVSRFRTVLDSCQISWHFWPYKKMNDNASMVFFNEPGEFVAISKYADSARNSFEEIRQLRKMVLNPGTVLQQYLDQCIFSNCQINQAYIEALGLNIK